MAKSFVMMGQRAGFDMTSEADMNAFMTAYNASLAAGLGGHPGLARGVPGSLASHKADRATKKKRQQAKVARQRNRPKKT